MASVFTNTGRQWLNDKLSGAVATTQNRIGWGTGAGTSAVSDTTLFAEDSTGGYSRATGTYTKVTTSVAGDTYRQTGTLTALANLSITNAGLFDAATSGVMMVKGDHAAIALQAGDSVTYTFDVQFG